MKTQVTTENGVVTLANVDAEGAVVGSISLPEPAFRVISELDGVVANKDLQGKIAVACGWSRDASKRNSQAVALMERFTPGYKAFNRHGIALLVGIVDNGKRFFKKADADFNAEEGAVMLTRQKKVSE